MPGGPSRKSLELYMRRLFAMSCREVIKNRIERILPGACIVFIALAGEVDSSTEVNLRLLFSTEC